MQFNFEEIETFDINYVYGMLHLKLKEAYHLDQSIELFNTKYIVEKLIPSASDETKHDMYVQIIMFAKQFCELTGLHWGKKDA